ncbi:hypothetical protein HZH68_006103 [Vespula germanica]|uniref:Uncharacterized protein n=1 Tax=Vespula germanica TaxID=30212 RepID=A0A834NCQ2_VESGE|nr:hypothetical protein HZH68_006103 [Vespula germanica]
MNDLRILKLESVDNGVIEYQEFALKMLKSISLLPILTVLTFNQENIDWQQINKQHGLQKSDTFYCNNNKILLIKLIETFV